jgi:hypothetical protein
VQRHQDDPFVLLGINTDESKAKYKKQAKEQGVTWRSSWQGSTSGPIPRQWRISGYPSKFILDGEGRIRYTNLRGKGLDKAVAELVAAEKAK